MPVLKKQDLVAIKNQYLKLQSVSDRELGRLLDRMQDQNKDEYSYNDIIKDYAICSAIASSPILISYEKLSGILEKKYGTTFQQFYFVVENADNLDSYSAVNDYGEGLNADINLENDQPKTNETESSSVEKNNFKLDDRIDRDDIFQEAMKNSSEKEEDKVYFNYIFFNDILDRKKEITDLITSDYEPNSSLGVGKDLLDNIEEDKEQDAEIRSDGKIKAYITLNERSKRSFLEKLKHPIRSIYEWYAKNKIAKELNQEFGLKEETLNYISDKIMQDKHDIENGKEVFDKNFVCFDKNGQMITTQTSMEDCAKAAKAMFPTTKVKNQSLENLADDTLTERKSLDKSEKYISNERSMDKEIGKD